MTVALTVSVTADDVDDALILTSKDNEFVQLMMQK